MPDNQKETVDSTLVDTNAKLLQNLQNYQIELEKLNESLSQTRAALEESNQHYAHLYDFAPVAYLTLLTEQGLIKKVNLSGTSLLGLNRQDLLQQPFADFISPTDSERWHLFFAQQIERGIPQSIELTLKSINGVQRYVQVDCLLMLDEGSFVLHVTLTDISERKQVEKICHDRDVYKSILATTLDGFCILNTEGKLIDVNRRYCELSGYTRKELLEMSITDLKAIKKNGDEKNSFVQTVIANGKAQFETVHRRKNGTLWAVEVSVTYQNFNGGMFYAFLRDISQRRQSEDELKANQLLISSILDSLTSHIAVLDKMGTIIAVNKGWQQFAEQNFPPGSNYKMLGCNYLDVCAKALQTDDDSEKVAEILYGITAVLTGTQPDFQTEYSCHSPNEQRWFYMMVSPLQGEVGGAVVNHHNITGRKRIEQQLQESEHKLASIFDILDVGLSITDEQGNLIDCNKRSELILGLSRQKILQRHYTSKEWQIIRPDFTPMPFEEYAGIRALTTNTTVSHVEMGVIKTDGNVVWLLVTSTPLRLKGYGVVTTYIDITELKRQQQAINVSEKRLRSIIEISPVPMALNDSQQNITFLNLAFIKTFGYELIDIPTLADWWSKAYPDPEYRHWIKKIRQPILAKAEAETKAQEQKYFTPIELIIRCKNGTDKTVLVSAAVLSDTFHTKTEHLVVLYDITTQKQAEAVLLKKREQLENQVVNSQEELEKIKIESNKISNALDVVLHRRETEPISAKNRLSQEMNTVILPLFKKVKGLCSDKHQQSLIETLENHLQQLSKSYGVDIALLPNDAKQLTPAEMQVALLIKQGLATKTIAGILNISAETVSTHRKHIRKKLKLDGTSSNLRNHLMMLLKDNHV